MLPYPSSDFPPEPFPGAPAVCTPTFFLPRAFVFTTSYSPKTGRGEKDEIDGRLVKKTGSLSPGRARREYPTPRGGVDERVGFCQVQPAKYWQTKAINR